LVRRRPALLPGRSAGPDDAGGVGTKCGRAGAGPSRRSREHGVVSGARPQPGEASREDLTVWGFPKALTHGMLAGFSADRCALTACGSRTLSLCASCQCTSVAMAAATVPVVLPVGRRPPGGR